MFVSCECRVLSGRGLCDGRRRPTECGVSESDREALIMRQPWPSRGCWAMKKGDEGLSLDKHMCDYLVNVFLIFTSWVWLFLSFLVTFAKLGKRPLASSCMSVLLSFCLSAWNKSAPTEHIFTKFDVWEFFEKLSRKFKCHYNRTRITGTLHEDQVHFLSYRGQFFLEWEMFQTKVVEKVTTHI